ncbi:hypothetical protein BGX28_003750 [Mortierella sp. GBA30]|nr:hypothetical protein BGX28_003750 [Mortierella sp. GBA30]
MLYPSILNKVILVMALIVGFCSIVPIRAALVDVVCTGTETATYTPGLTLELLSNPQPIQVDVIGILDHCISSDGDIKSGTYHESFNATVSCLSLLDPRPGTRVFRWSNGKTSTFPFNRALNDVGSETTVTFTGSITDGEFAGDTALEQVVLLSLNTLQCLSPCGITKLGPGTIALTLTGIDVDVDVTTSTHGQKQVQDKPSSDIDA